MACCAINYRRLLCLLPGLDEGPREGSFGLPDGACLSLRTVVRNPYTSTLEVTAPASWGRAPVLVVQVYHDAELAEVVGWSRHRRPEPCHTYPNARMFQRDEKAQWNGFLGEWLSHCLSRGHCLHDPRTADCEL